MFAPVIDNIIESLKKIPPLVDSEMHSKLTGIFQEMNCIKPGENDEIRMLWLEVPRGTIKNFGRFSDFKKEEMAETYEGFLDLWRDYYPDDTKWYSITTAKYDGKLFFYFDSDLIFTVNETEPPARDSNRYEKDIYRFLDWLRSRIKKEITKLKQDVDSYNNYLEQNLSYNKRIGRIKRKDFWNILGDDAIRLNERLGSERLDKLRKVADALKNQNYPVIIPRMTANDYFRYCEICYDANDYFKKSDEILTPLQKYGGMADGRDGGLCSIKGNSEKAFNDWYHGKKWQGTHPWEICRGGNSTHISLLVYSNENNWNLILDGSSIIRVEETVKMAIALHDNNIPFILREAGEILHMVSGNDYIGIVPDYQVPRYCYNLFPAKDRIIDFMNLGYEDSNEIIKRAYWYPLERIDIP